MFRQKLFLYFTGLFILVILSFFLIISNNVKNIFSKYEKNRLKDSLSEIEREYMSIKFNNESILLSLVSKYRVISLVQKLQEQNFYTLKEKVKRELISELVDLKKNKSIALLRLYDTKSNLVLDLYNLNRISAPVSPMSKMFKIIKEKKKSELIVMESGEYIYTFSSPIYSSEGFWIGTLSIGFNISKILSKVRLLTGFHLFFVKNENGTKKLLYSTMKFLSVEGRKKFERKIDDDNNLINFSSDGKEYILGSVLRLNNKEKYIIYGSIENLKIKYLLEDLHRHFLIIFLISLLCSIMLTFYISRLVTSPLKKLMEVNKRIGEGNLETEIHLETDDEFQMLADTVNSMIEKIKISDTELRSFNSELQNEISNIKEELNFLHNELKNAEKLSALGVFAAGVVHEIKNPLSTLKGTTSYLKNKAKEDEFQYKYLNTMVSEIDRIQKITKNIMSYARQDRDVRVINEIIEPIQTILNSDLVKEKIFLNVEIIDNLKFNIPADNLKQIILNLVLNSKAAIKDKPGHIKIKVLKKSEKVGNIIVEDDGVGIPAELREKVFEPFFSFRKVDGTGIGLSIVKKIILEFDGSIVIGNPKIGCEFIIELPLIS